MSEASRTLAQALDTQAWPPVLLISGEDRAERDGLIARILETLPEPERLTGVDRFEDGPLARVLDAARTMPLLGGRRIVILHSSQGLGESEAARDALLDYLESPPAHALLVIVLDKIDRRQKLFKAVAKKGLVLQCDKPRERQMPRWIQEQAGSLGLRLRGDAVQAIADAVGTDTGLASRELEKLALIAGSSERPLDAASIEPLLGPTRSVGAFALEDALLAGRGREAIEALRRHMDGANTQPLALLARLAGICRRLTVAAATVEEGGGEAQVQAALGCHPFVAKKYASAARRRGGRGERALAACVTADGLLKSGHDPWSALSPIVLALVS